MCNCGQRCGLVVTVVSKLEGSWSEPQQGSFCVELACSPCVCVGFLRVLRVFPLQSKDVHVGLIGGPKLPVVVIVCD